MERGLHRVSSTFDSGPDAESKSTFNVVIVYEDFETGRQARQTYDFLAQNLSGDSQLAHRMWKFEVLGIPRLCEAAARDAANADLIIVSARSPELPPAARKWTENWLRLGSRAMVLVALFDCPQGGNIPARSYLAEVAKEGGMEFFARPAEPAVGDTFPRLTPLGRNRVDLERAALSVVSAGEPVDISVPRWGINE